MPKSKGARGGVLGTLGNGIWLIIVAGLILGFVRVNDITSLDKAYDYFKSWSDAADKCVGEDPLTTQLKDCGRDGIITDDPTTPPITPPGSGGGLEDSPTPIEEDKTKLEEILEKDIPVKPVETVTYDRADWKHWSDFDGDGCDAREETLKSQGENVKTGDYCKILSGTWIDPYSGAKMTDSSKIDIDHVIPLGWVAKHGGQNWSSARKEEYANDPLILLISSPTENRSKSDAGPDEWLVPHNEKFRCAYAALWVKGLKKYELSIDKAGKAALADALGSCSK